MEPTAQEIYQGVKAVLATINDLEGQASLLRKEYRRLSGQMSLKVAEDVYGLQVGDVIEVTVKQWRDKVKVYRLKIESFDARDPDDAAPVIKGVVVKKDGKEGVRRESVFPRLSEYKYRIVAKAGE